MATNSTTTTSDSSPSPGDPEGAWVLPPELEYQVILSGNQVVLSDDQTAETILVRTGCSRLVVTDGSVFFYRIVRGVPELDTILPPGTYGKISAVPRLPLLSVAPLTPEEGDPGNDGASLFPVPNPPKRLSDVWEGKGDSDPEAHTAFHDLDDIGSAWNKGDHDAYLRKLRKHWDEGGL